MPFVAAPNIIMTEFRYTLNAQQCENRVMIDNLAAVDAAALEATAILAWNWWEAHLAPQTSEHCLLREVVCTDLTTDSGGQFTYAPDSTTTGTITGAAMPNECSVCVSLRSASRGRSARGRFFTAGVPREAMTDDNHINNGYAGALASALGNLITQVAAAGQAVVIVSYFHDNAPRVGGPVYFPLTTALVVDTVIDSQRKRKPGVGT